MNFVYELVKKEQPDIPQKTVEYLLTLLNRQGLLSYTVQYHYEIYDFYNKQVDYYKSQGLEKKCAVQDTMQQFKISRGYLFRILAKFNQKNQ